MAMFFWHNRRERLEIGRVHETIGILSRSAGEKSKSCKLDGEALCIPYTMDIDCSAYVRKSVIFESAAVLHLRCGQGG